MQDYVIFELITQPFKPTTWLCWDSVVSSCKVNV